MNNIKVYLNTLRLKGYLAYEYNPFHNYQTNVDLYLKEGFLIPKGKAVNPKNGLLLDKKEGKWVDKKGNIIEEVLSPKEGETPLYVAGSLIDLDTDKLNFDLEHPVDITVQPSYDGSVNLILNDDKNIPRLINSRFSVREKGTYEIVDRIGENDTNVYSSNTFEKDTSLYFLYEYNPIILYLGQYNGGNLLAGSYCFYFTYCDSDDNESDIVAETGIIPIFIGSDSYPDSVEGGIKNINTYKQVGLRLSNMDKSYNYFKIYYVRYFADYSLNRVYECKKISQKYPIKSSNIYIQITGNEEAEDLDANILNISRFNPKSILTQAQCKNMLFFGNIVKNTDNYKELIDCALRIIPELYIEDFNNISNSYSFSKGSGAYYNSVNVYNQTGYFDNEYYRFGVVFIYNNGTLSNVYNTLGGEIVKTPIKHNDNSFWISEENSHILKRKYISIDDSGWINNSSDIFENNTGQLNSKGVCKLSPETPLSDNKILGIKFNIPKIVVKFLKEDLGIRGLFFVRQKRIPNTIAQCYLMPFDELLEAPVIETKNEDYSSNYYTECFLSLGTQKSIEFAGWGLSNYKVTRTWVEGAREVTNSYSDRIYKYSHTGEGTISSRAYAAICPDFLLNLPYYNQIFNGSNFKILRITKNNFLLNPAQTYSGRHFRTKDEVNYELGDLLTVKICSLTEEVPTVALNDIVYKLRMGEPEEVFRFKYCEIDNGKTNSGDEDYDRVNGATNLVRGIYSPYLAIYSNVKLETSELYNIYLENSNNYTQLYLDRMNSSEPFYAISDRYNFENLSVDNTENLNLYNTVCWRGDCYLNTFTYRLNRNFNDSSLPNNDVIIDLNTWIENYDVTDSGKWANISRSDINAVQLGSWITFKCRSSMNYALRSLDHSYVSEEATMGVPRSYYPRSQSMLLGENKMPDSYVYNDAYRTSLGFKCYFTLNDPNYIKNTFSNRILYSAISILDSFKNNYRESLSTYFRDYSQEYGGITKLVEYNGNLLIIFEHAVGLATINERILAGQGDGEPVFINTKNVLPEELTIITDTYGSLWTESIIKSEAGYVYGVDTIAKKIWRVRGQNFEILSDFKVNKFLIENISLGERETSPIIGLKNVKTHYNNNKKDVMFTFYDDVYKDEEKVWNLCYNELLGQFVTFYSWVPSYSENIDTLFFTFNREISKELSLLEKCNYNIEENTGILLDSPILKLENGSYLSKLHYRVPQIVSIKNLFNDTQNNSKVTELPTNFKIELDHWGNNKYFSVIKEKDGNNYILTLTGNKNELINKLKNTNRRAVLLLITPLASLKTNLVETGVTQYYKSETVAVTFEEIIKNNRTKDNIPDMCTDFYLHGKAGIFNVAENLYPTYWYGEFHPFEFEFVVNDKVAQLKIFNNLVIISNKAEPESFHFEIEGDNYEFSSDKRAMYVRQETTKNLYLNLGSDILFNRKYYDVVSGKYTLEQSYRAKNKDYTEQYSKMDRVYPIYEEDLVLQVKSTIFPLYYEKIDTYNDIYHKYHMMHDNDGIYDFQNLSGSEIAWDRDLNQFNIITHIKNNPIDLVGRLRGNSFYKEGTWNVLIPSITFMLKNETDWSTNKEGKKVPPIVINSQYVPKKLDKTNLGIEDLPNIYTGRLDNVDKEDSTKVDYSIDPAKYVDTSSWTARKETKIRDKWIKIRIRYSGKNLAVIHSLITLYNISYS